MADILLIHGAGHGAWCWREVIPLLRVLGHEVRAIDLPGRGASPAPADGITAESHRDAILAALGERTVLVGHSLAGMWISMAAEAAPERIARLVYLCAWAPRNGDSARALRVAADARALLEATLPADEGRRFTFADNRIEALFYQDCPPGTLDHARANLVAEPTLPAQTPVTLTGRFDSVPRSYIRCLADGAIPPAYQIAASDGWAETHDLACGHSPFFVMPARLAGLIDRIARS